MVFFLLMLLVVFGGVTWYLSKRIHTALRHFFKNLSFKSVLIFFSILTVIMILGVARLNIPFFSTLFEILSGYFMGVFIYLFIFCLLADIIGLICRLLKAPFYKSALFCPISVFCVIVATVITVAYGIINARDIKVTSYEIKLEEKTDISDMSIVMLSDLHIGAVGMEGRLPEIVDKINSLSPDLVLISGDIFDTDFSAVSNPEKVVEDLKKINSSYGTFACLGNHDGGETLDEMLSTLEKANVTLLMEDYTVIDERLVLVGRLDRHSIGGYDGLSRGELSDFFKSDNKDLPVIVLDHNPSSIDSYTNEVDLVLSGHTHKGQLFPASILTNLMYVCDYGYYQKNDDSPQLIVSSGVGYWGMPMRVGTKSEIVSIKFK